MINTIIGIFGLVLPIILACLDKKRTNKKSCFFSYIKITEEDFVKKLYRKSLFMFGAFLILYAVCIVNSTWVFLPISTSTSNEIVFVAMIVYVFIFIIQLLGKFFFVYGDIKYLDKKLIVYKEDITKMNSVVWGVDAILCVMFLLIPMVVNCFFDKNVVAIIGTILTLIGIEAVFSSFVSIYIKIRRWYYVESINIKTKTNKIIYNDIINYKIIDNRECDFVCKKDEKQKRFKVPISEIEFIEYNINTKVTYLDKNRADLLKQDQEVKGKSKV